MGTLSKIQHRKQMNYKKQECIQCGKEFRQVLDHAWIVYCSPKCADEHERNTKTSREDDRDLRQSA
jgi:hypothetical protein